ncbi:FAD-dependent oxidoreductase [Streptomyces sp. NPDC059853]|uniref:NAD(P)-binding protein n=1 Tax=Streptomyces sp. NPDC059853 TaxID=3346973 RepID=UPI0036672A48
MIGGGISGLATALLLGRRGHPVTVFEQNGRRSPRPRCSSAAAQGEVTAHRAALDHEPGRHHAPGAPSPYDRRRPFGVLRSG